MAKMACLPQATGGRHFNAQNAEQVAAYIEEALLLTASEMGGVADSPPASPAATAIVPPPPIPASGPPALHLRALLAPNTEPLGIAVVLDRDGGSSTRCAHLRCPGRQPHGSRDARAIHGRGARRPAIGQANRGSARQRPATVTYGAQRGQACASACSPARNGRPLAGCSHHGNRRQRRAPAGRQGRGDRGAAAGRPLSRARRTRTRACRADRDGHRRAACLPSTSRSTLRDCS